jgi:uncharacterized protein
MAGANAAGAKEGVMKAQAGNGWTENAERGGTKLRIARVARLTLLAVGVSAASMGPLLMFGYRQVLQLHELFGLIAILSLWTLAAVGAWSGVARWKVVLAAAWGLIAWSVGGAQRLPYGAGLHLLTQVLHVGTSIGVMAGGMLLARAVLKKKAAAGATGTLAAAAAEFLALKRIAVTGVSRRGDGGHGSNQVYRRLRERGHEVFAVNPNANVVEGDRAYPDLGSIPGGVDGVVIGTKPERAMGTVRECVDLGIRRVWMHRGISGGSVSPEAAAWGRAQGLLVIDGGCPLMFGACADPGHKVMRGLLSLTGRLPRRVA